MNKKRLDKNSAIDFCMNNIVWILLACSILIMGIFQPAFFTLGILTNILVQGTVLGILAIAVSMIIVLGDINLSGVGTAGFSALIGVLLIKNTGLPWGFGIIAMILVGAAIGLINGLIVSKLKANALIETLAMNMVLQGAVLAITGGRTISSLPEGYKYISQGKIGGFPILPIVLIIIFIIFYIIWNKTAFGRSLFAVGGNSSSAYAAGINVNMVRIKAFVVSGILGSIAGYLLSAYMGAVTTSFGSTYEMQCIAAAVIGGVSLIGGKGSIFGILGGTLLLTVIQVGLSILGIPSTYVNLAGGLMIFVAVLIDASRSLYQKKH